MKGLLTYKLVALIVCLKYTETSPIEYDEDQQLPSQRCLQVFQQVVEQHKDNGCIPIDQIMPLTAEIKRDPINSVTQMNQIADIICQKAPACTPEFLNRFKEDINAQCVGQDANNTMVTGSIKLINNYTPARDMACLKDPSGGGYCAVKAVQWVLQNHPDIDDMDDLDDLEDIEPTKEMCTPCTKGWIEQYDKYAPQYPDLKGDTYVPKLKAVCQSQ